MILLPEVYFDGKASSEYSLALASVVISEPAVKSIYIDIPCGDGSLDYTDYFGEPKYKDRTLTMTFWSTASWEDRCELDTLLNNELNGKRMKIRFEHDTEYYWIGRISVGELEYRAGTPKLTITAQVEPYRYKLEETTVSETLSATAKEIALPNDRKTVCPDITTTGSVTLTYDGKTVMHNAGEGWKLADLLIPAGGRTITASGSGTITFTYQGASL